MFWGELLRWSDIIININNAFSNRKTIAVLFSRDIFRATLIITVRACCWNVWRRDTVNGIIIVLRITILYSSGRDKLQNSINIYLRQHSLRHPNKSILNIWRRNMKYVKLNARSAYWEKKGGVYYNEPRTDRAWSHSQVLLRSQTVHFL